jgi:hypothetical protein
MAMRFFHPLQLIDLIPTKPLKGKLKITSWYFSI